MKSIVLIEITQIKYEITKIAQGRWRRHRRRRQWRISKPDLFANTKSIEGGGDVGGVGGGGDEGGKGTVKGGEAERICKK
ncbi:hypothetical protein U1Q18_035371 [Sarracenia purpurea var. burkii]